MYSKKYKPSSRIKRRNNARKMFSLVMAILAPTLLVIMLVLFLRSDFMKVSNIELVGGETLPKDEIRNEVLSQLSGSYLFFIPKTNSVFIKEDKLESLIMENFPRVVSATATHGLNGTLTINLQERSAEYLWCNSGGECYLVDREGLIFARANEAEAQGKIRFSGNEMANPENKRFVSKEKMLNYIEVIKKLSSFVIVHSVFEEMPNKSNFNTSIGKIILNPEEDMGQGIPYVELLYSELKNKKPDVIFEYVDARYGKKLFYKALE